MYVYPTADRVIDREVVCPNRSRAPAIMNPLDTCFENVVFD